MNSTKTSPEGLFIMSSFMWTRPVLGPDQGATATHDPPKSGLIRNRPKKMIEQQNQHGTTRSTMENFHSNNSHVETSIIQPIMPSAFYISLPFSRVRVPLKLHWTETLTLRSPRKIRAPGSSQDRLAVTTETALAQQASSYTRKNRAIHRQTQSINKSSVYHGNPNP